MTARTCTAACVTVLVTLAAVACGGAKKDVAADDPIQPPGAGAEPSGGGAGGGAGTALPTGGDGSVWSDGTTGGSATTQAPGVAGTVSHEEGEPVAGALVTPSSLDTPASAIPEVAVFTNDDGRYTWVLPPGRYRITVTADGYLEASAEAEVPAGGTATLDVELSRARPDA